MVGAKVLDSRLASRAVLGEALKTLTDDADFWTFHIARSQFDWEKGVEQSSGVVIRKGQQIELGKNLDIRLVRSRRVHLVVSWDDGGSVHMDITGRIHHILTPSQSAKQGIDQFESAMKQGRSSPLITPGFAALLVFLPLVIIFTGLIFAYFIDPTMRHSLVVESAKNSPTYSSYQPHWLSSVSTFAVLTWPITLTASGLIMSTRFATGGLRINKSEDIRTSFRMLLYRMRSESSRFDNWRQILIGATGGVLIAFLTFWFKK